MSHRHFYESDEYFGHLMQKNAQISYNIIFIYTYIFKEFLGTICIHF